MEPITLSPDLHERIIEKICRAPHPQSQWHPDLELSGKVINELLTLPTWQKNAERSIQQKWETRMEEWNRAQLRVLLRKSFLYDICEELRWPDGIVTPEHLDAIIAGCDLLSHCKKFNLNIKSLVKNTTAQMVVKLSLGRPYNANDWRRDSDYKYVSAELDFFNVNPARIIKHFPTKPERNGQEFIKPADLIFAWDNACSDAVCVVPVSQDLNHFIAHWAAYNKAIIIHKGSEIWYHNYDNGITSWPVVLQRDMPVVQAFMPYDFLDERFIREHSLISSNAFKMRTPNRITPMPGKDLKKLKKYIDRL